MPAFLLSKWFWFGVALAGCFAAGWQVNQWRWQAKEADAIQKAADTGQSLQRTAHQAEVNYLDRIAEDREFQRDRANNLQKLLAEQGKHLHACRIDSDILRVLNREPGTGTASDAASNRPGAADVGAGTTCAALAQTFDENHGRFTELRAQLQACRAFYRDVRQKYCLETAAC